MPVTPNAPVPEIPATPDDAPVPEMSNPKEKKPKSSFTDVLGKIYFGFLFLMFMGGTALVCRIYIIMHKCKMISAKTRARWSMRSAGHCWTCIFALSPQIKINRIDFGNWNKLGKSGKPVAILQNHICNFDVFLVNAVIPQKILQNTKYMVAQGIFKQPIIGTIVTACMHIKIYFTGKNGQLSEDTEKLKEMHEQGRESYDPLEDFKIDTEKRDATAAAVQKQIDEGGVLFFYPEGSRSKDETVVRTFRKGGVKTLYDNDMEVWAIICSGNSLAWPLRDAMAGRPCEVNVKIIPVAPEGTKTLMGDADPDSTGERMQQIFQRTYNEIKVDALDSAEMVQISAKDI